MERQEKVWAIFSPGDRKPIILPFTIRTTKRQCIEDFEHNRRERIFIERGRSLKWWDKLKKDGYQCRKVVVVYDN